jgi:hypothetical protein
MNIFVETMRIFVILIILIMGFAGLVALASPNNTATGSEIDG